MMKKVFPVLLFLLLVVSTVGAGEPQGLTIISVTPAKGGIYAIASVEFPKNWSDAEFTLELNGRPVRMRRAGGGFSQDRNMADLMFMPARGAKQSLTVKCIAGTAKAEAKTGFDWTPVPLVTILGHTGDREIITARERLTVAAVNVTGVKIFFNGKEVSARPSAGDIPTLSFDPAWKRGKNVLAINADKLDGGVIAKNFTFFDLGDGGMLPLGESALLYCGREGSKSGPFYDVKVEGDSVVLVQGTRALRDTIDRDGWLVSEAWVGAEVKARKEGTSKVRVFVKPHFLQSMELEREISVTVGGR